MKLAFVVALCAASTASADRQWLINHHKDDAATAHSAASQSSHRTTHPSPVAQQHHSSTRTELQDGIEAFNEDNSPPFRSELTEPDYVDSLLGSLDGGMQIISNGQLTDAVQSHSNHDDHQLQWAVYSESDGVLATGQDPDTLDTLLLESADEEEEDDVKPIDPWHDTDDSVFMGTANRRGKGHTRGGLIKAELLDEGKHKVHRYNEHLNTLLEDAGRRRRHFRRHDSRSLLRQLRDAINEIVADQN
ncbi:hypothetical protein DYB25_008646 [Aphanomyces astaci]|uniref:RxLR effector protein n=1 Tax=Aphanomyces astaci TaxID=112090 RepID=A0A397F0Z2_APHAT|nr:hypothetical protein AaE_012720 [Aphanomyces astaci]RHY04721.1 hypothetical protein DYB25_008646 [Aphanomyces astaci]RHY07469.1 hypothetical protein DYB36_010442 [Aphanomyces astaci]RHY35692.1 hypothetical protein DYB34_003570 [Aphanomyces astaci]RHY54503.1 hypothetical protein DYB38_005303 [Aphanomyces astaci]